MSLLRELLFQRVMVLCTDGTLYIGNLEAYDRTTNLVLSRAQERTVHTDTPPSICEIGAFVIRGDCVAMIGLVDPEMEPEEAWAGFRGTNMPNSRLAWLVWDEDERRTAELRQSHEP